MDRWRGKIALVTGAASGIGKSITHRLLAEGVNVVALDLQMDKLKKDAEENNVQRARGTMYPLQCDLSKSDQLEKSFQWIESNLKGVDVMVNNAGVVDYCQIIDSDRATFERLVGVNFLAVASCISLAVKSMRARGSEGHIFNINSVLGHVIPESTFSSDKGLNGWNLYPACKHAGVALTETVKREISSAKLPIRITSICPGLVQTELATKFEKLHDVFDKVPCLDPNDVADVLIFALGARSEVQISELTVQRTGEVP